MPLDLERCDCGSKQHHCPECGSNMVTPRENFRSPTPTSVIDTGGPEEVTYRHVCWECGWDETVTMTVERGED